MSSTPFLDKLASSQRIGGIYLFENYLTPEESKEAYSLMNDNFPWDLNPTLFGERQVRHAFEYDRLAPTASRMREDFSGLAHLESLCRALEHDFDVKVQYVTCNRFQHSMHCIPWHKDTYGRHIMVLSLGSSRMVQFRDNTSGKIETIEPSSGDLYFMPLRMNDTHKHRVCGTDDEDAGTRLSFVFFVKPPKYANDFKITRMDKLKGRFTELTGIGA